MAVAFSTDAAALWRAWEAAPNDEAVMGALADELDATGDGLGADAIRWLAAKGRRVFKASKIVPADGLWYAWGKEASKYVGATYPDALPLPLYSSVRRLGDNVGLCNWFKTWRPALDALLEGWRRLDDSERAACRAWWPSDGDKYHPADVAMLGGDPSE